MLCLYGHICVHISGILNYDVKTEAELNIVIHSITSGSNCGQGDIDIRVEQQERVECGPICNATGLRFVPQQCTLFSSLA